MKSTLQQFIHRKPYLTADTAGNVLIVTCQYFHRTPIFLPYFYGRFRCFFGRIKKSRKTDENHIRFICGGKLPAGAGFVFCAAAMTRIPSAFNSKDIKKPPPRKDTLRKRWLFEFIHRKIICDHTSVFISKKSLIFTLRIPFLLRLISSIDTTYLG